MFVKCDVTSDEEFEDAYNTCEKQLGKITILCNNAGVFARDYKTSMDIIFGAVVRGTELALKRMGKHNGGEGGFVVNTGSTIGVARFPLTPMYCASKAAVIHYTRCMGHEFHYNYSGVHILSVNPGPVDTPFITLEGYKRATLNSYADKVIEEIIDNLQKMNFKRHSKLQLVSLQDFISKILSIDFDHIFINDIAETYDVHINLTYNAVRKKMMWGDGKEYSKTEISRYYPLKESDKNRAMVARFSPAQMAIINIEFPDKYETFYICQADPAGIY
ncbi:Dehydrogenase/reductase SDR family member 7 [Armadillidium nasatum]|uniref:15-hydroxyprostaglandin dehydrogenase [NAD(+)] n=1 Tax=Armadillidium nasatum TaxID=96803 RepID=A0A5N5SSW8_9CRUS|nr:Dehydrogenase/reductase SDR family member 7 [Armadillidium nasatum]